MKSNRKALTRGLSALVLTALAAGGAFVASAQTATADPTANLRLASAIDTYSASFGLPQSSLSKVKAANLPAGVANALGAELEQLYACDKITQTQLPALMQTFKLGLTDSQLGAFPGTQTSGQTILGVPITAFPDPNSPVMLGFEAALRSCGDSVVTRLDAVKTQIASANLPDTAALDAWPVLRLSPGNVNDIYVNDYVLLVDAGGTNKLFNNAGGNALDIFRGPAGSIAKTIGSARGCIDAVDLIRAQTCTFAASAALVMSDGNQFEKLEAPDANTDGLCTNDPVTKRIVTQGAGLAGVGVLIVEGSNNAFYGKSINNGFGHIFGYGYQRTDGDNNTYTTIRSALGSSILAGVGTFIANGSHNSYTTYVPGPKDPNAAKGMLGSGGVASDLNNCDSGQAVTLGAGTLAGIGRFEANGVDNTYNAPIQSLGYGGQLGKGRFHQGGSGTDTYTGPGAAGRGNNVTVNPTTTNNGQFIDN
jgi:hypothetical protein